MILLVMLFKTTNNLGIICIECLDIFDIKLQVKKF